MPSIIGPTPEGLRPWDCENHLKRPMNHPSPAATLSSSHAQVAPAQGVVLEQLQAVDALLQQNRFVDALTALAQLTTVDMCNPRVWLAIGLTYTRMANWSQAVSALEAALQFAPGFAEAKQLLALALFSMGQQKRACELIDEVVTQGGDSSQWMMRAYLHAHTNRDPLHALEVAQDWGRRFADSLTRQAAPLAVNDCNPRKRLKIGYVTADFRQHSVAFFMQPVLAHHDPEVVEVHVYSNGPADAVTEYMRGLVPHWHDVQALSDEAMLAQIRAEGIDVLVDLSGFTHGHRLEVFARRAAPVQVTWLGYLLPLGMKSMDYRIVSRKMAPRSHAAFYSEKLVHMSGSACYVPPDYAPRCEILPMTRNGYPTMISMNNSGKITNEILTVWSRILNFRKDARLIIVVKEGNASLAQEHMKSRVENSGMPVDRVSVLPQLPLNNFMELGHVADIALDTSPISGGTTTLHTIWMGLPIVTFRAQRSVDACTEKILKGRLAFCGEVAGDADEYVAAACGLMADPDRLMKIRSESRSLLQSSSIMNYKKRTADVEKAFRCMWINYLLGRYDSIDIDEYEDYVEISDE